MADAGSYGIAQTALFPRRSEPLEVQATSYLAASDNIFNFSSRVRDDDKYIVIKSFRMYVLITE